MAAFFKKNKLLTCLIAFVVSVGLFVLYSWLYISVWNLELPKTRSLRLTNARLSTRAEVLGHGLDLCDNALDAMKIRDEDIYRSIFGLNAISDDVREAGLQGDNRYVEIDEIDRTGRVAALARKADRVTKKAYVQTRSYDEVTLMLNNAGELSTSIPAICPVNIADPDINVSSPFGVRNHPVLGFLKMHNGMDFSMKPGHPVYATGDARVSEIRIEMHGYGRQIILDHGFGYKTRYAHLKNILVTEGTQVKRGQQIATSGNSGLTSGPHLHYEVLYKGKYKNPYNYFDKELTSEQYSAMIVPAKEGSQEFYVHPMHRKK